MAKKRRARSIRGEVVDFDLFDIKNQMASQPKSTEVRAREDFIESRLRRRKSRLERNRKAKLEATTKVEVKQETLIKPEVDVTVQTPTEEIQKATESVEPKTRRIKKKKVE